MKELWQYQGKPDDEEIQLRIGEGYHLAGSYSLRCPSCSHTHTQFIRNHYWICFDCAITFTTSDTYCYSSGSYELIPEPLGKHLPPDPDTCWFPNTDDTADANLMLCPSCGSSNICCSDHDDYPYTRWHCVSCYCQWHWVIDYEGDIKESKDE